MSIGSYAQAAAVEHLWSHTIGIANRAIVTRGTDPGTGLPAQEQEAPGTAVAGIWGKHHFILTANHVLDEAVPDDLSFFVRPTGSLRQVSEVTIQDGLVALPLNDRDATIHRCGWEDLALLTTKPDALSPYLEFVDIASSWIDPQEGETVVGVGYPVSSGVIFRRQVGPCLQQAVLLCPMGFSGAVLPPTTGRNFGAFDPDRHYLIPYELANQGKHPKGISGAAVWGEAAEKHIVWTPRFKFAGICTSCYRDGTVEQIVKASVVRQFLLDVLGTPEK